MFILIYKWFSYTWIFRLNRELENLYAEVDRIAVAERLEYEEKLREENHVEIPRVAIYGLGAILIVSSDKFLKSMRHPFY